MGLLRPDKGKISIDGVPIESGNLRSWQKKIAHVPQEIYLADSSIAKNIAFGVAETDIDMSRVERCAEVAQIAEFISSISEGYSTRVGEKGVLLSGGQRQRIGIARALYKQSEVLVFDEATSALDDETERLVIEGIEKASENLTLIMIAHRISSIKFCDLVIQMKNGQVVKKGKIDEILD